MEPVEPVKMNIYQSNTCRKHLSWLHFNNEPRVQERQQAREGPTVLNIWFCSLSRNSKYNYEHQPRYDHSTPCMAVWQYGRFIEITSNLRRKKLLRTNQGSNFLGGTSGLPIVGGMGVAPPPSILQFFSKTPL